MKLRNIEDVNLYKNQQLSRNNGFIEHLNLSIIDRYIPYDKNAMIVDVGCRSGQTIQTLIRFGYRNAYGLDLGDTTWSGLSADVKNNFIKCDIHDGIPLNEKIDFILCSHMFEHVYDPKKILSIFKSKLKDNGVLYISVPLDYNYKGMKHDAHYTFFESQDDLKKFLEENGFVVIEIETNNTGPGGMPEVLSFSKIKSNNV
jgi:2-polyprenyl-3-methyl-5-hydroxy-6-metoxy-1,4-benzoquinol methylase